MAGDTTCASRAVGTMQSRKIQRDQLWSSFPGKPRFQQYQRETDEQKHKHGSDSEKKLQHRSGISGQIRRHCLGPEFKSWDSGSYAQVGMKPNPRRRRSSASSVNCYRIGVLLQHFGFSPDDYIFGEEDVLDNRKRLNGEYSLANGAMRARKGIQKRGRRNFSLHACDLRRKLNRESRSR